MNWTVAKFGGSSLASGAHFHAVARLVSASPTPLAVVVSAPGDSTDRLKRLAERAVEGEEVSESLNGWFDEVAEYAKADLSGLRSEGITRLEGIRLLRELSDTTLAAFLSLGERVSAALLTAQLQALDLPAHPVDARKWLHTVGPPDDGEVDWPKTLSAFDATTWSLPVVTGFIATGPDGRTSTLGRDGSDYTAAILGAVLDAKEVQIWTDVPGVLTADPAIVPHARPLQHLTFGEALELSVFGARVLHARTLVPLIDKSIPLRILHTKDPDAPGTRIDAAGADDTNQATSIASLDDLSLLHLSVRSVEDTAQLLRRIQRALAHERVWLETTAAHGQAWSAAISQHRADAAIATLKHQFRREFASGDLAPIQRRDGVSLVTVVAEAMGRTPNVAGRFFGALGRQGINVLASGQSGSARSISAVVADGPAAVRAVHDAFHLDDAVVSIAVLGVGTVGREVVSQLLGQRETLKQELGIDSRLVALTTRSWSIFQPQGIRRVTKSAQLPIEDIVARLAQLPNPVLVDCTAEDQTSVHLAALRAGVHVVSANKKPFAGPQRAWDQLKAAADEHHRDLRYETTVGAALPVIQTLRDLRRTGDRVKRVEGSVSGTLGFLAAKLMAGATLSSAIQEAKALGFTEPNPAEDLSGADVARKGVILARELGLRIDPEQVALTPFIPEHLLQAPDFDALLAGITAWEPELLEYVASLKEQGLALRYLVEVDVASGAVTVGPRSVDRDHPAYGTKGAEAFIAFTTSRYDTWPLRVQGPGAGGAVTASGVVSDILRVTDALRIHRPTPVSEDEGRSPSGYAVASDPRSTSWPTTPD